MECVFSLAMLITRSAVAMGVTMLNEGIAPPPFVLTVWKLTSAFSSATSESAFMPVTA